MSFSPEEEGFAAEFLNNTQVKKPTVFHPIEQLSHVENRIGKAEAGLIGESDIQTFTYTIKDKRLLYSPDFSVKQAVDRGFVNGMIGVAKYLRRNVR